MADKPKRPTQKMVAASILKDLDDELSYAEDSREKYRNNYDKGYRVGYWLRRERMPSDGRQ